MTDQLIMTTAQRDQAMKALQVATTHFAKDRNEIAKAYTMLQSLLMVSAEPAIYTVFDKDGDPVVSFLTKENCHEHINEAVMNNIPDAAKCYVRAMHTSPQALTDRKITELEAQLADVKQVVNDCRIVANNAIAEALAAKQDAERYQALRRGQKWSVIDGIGDTLRAEGLDEAIDDAAIQAEGKA